MLEAKKKNNNNKINKYSSLIELFLDSSMKIIHL